ncbi:MAG: DeoR/GlpR transcriptional regulator [Bacteroidales bacterium]|nr:DeoR/GlpR transcriptional regulator [Bacteroidales bacterium]
MLSAHDRQKLILSELKQKGYVRVQDLAGSLGVTGATLRSDLRILESQHLLQRNHGSAFPIKQKVIDLPVQEKSSIRAAEKQRIALAAANMVGEDDAIIMTSGTTIETLAQNIKAKGILNVVTPSIRVGVFLSEHNDINILMLGGHLIKNSLSVRDTYTLEGLKNITCSKLFFSCDGFDLEAGVTTAFVEEARMTNAMMDTACQAILLADSSKCRKIGFGKICDFARVNTLITDTGLAPDIKKQIENAGVKVVAV